MKNYSTLLLVAFVSTLSQAANNVAAAETSTAKPIAVNGAAIDFTLPVVNGKGEVTLSDEYKQGPVVLVVLRGYPGYQCPLCSRQVGALVQAAAELGKTAQRVILVYPGEPSLLDQHAEEFMGETVLPKPLVLVRDPGMKMVSDWHLRWDAPRETAYPSTYIVDGQGKVRWSKISHSHGDRTTAQEILSELKKL